MPSSIDSQSNKVRYAQATESLETYRNRQLIKYHGQHLQHVLKHWTYAPLYCATSSPSTNTLSFDSSSSASASLSASRTATSLTPLGEAYLLLGIIDARGVLGLSSCRLGAVKGLRDESKRAVGRSSRAATMLGKPLRNTGGDGDGWWDNRLVMRPVRTSSIACNVAVRTSATRYSTTEGKCWAGPDSLVATDYFQLNYLVVRTSTAASEIHAKLFWDISFQLYLPTVNRSVESCSFSFTPCRVYIGNDD